MNYDRAMAELKHARTHRKMDSRKLCNATRLLRVFATDKDGNTEQHASLELFQEVILTWKPNGNIALTSAGYKTITTRDRYTRYLPSGFRVWQERPYWYIRTPSGTRPFRDGMEVRPDGWDITLPKTLNELDARELKTQTFAYAKLYADKLVRGMIAQNPSYDCPSCSRIAASRKEFDEGQRLHLLEHVQYHHEVPAGLLRAALNRAYSSRLFGHKGKHVVTRTFMHEVVAASWTEAQKLWRTPRTHRALLEQTELKLLAPELPRMDIRPRAHVMNIRWLLEDFLLGAFYFEEM